MALLYSKFKARHFILSRMIIIFIVIVLIWKITVCLQFFSEKNEQIFKNRRPPTFENKEIYQNFSRLHEKLKNSQTFSRKYQNESKYILPVLLWGPSNQLLGLQESILLAKLLNRTLILPKLYRHYLDPTTKILPDTYNDVLSVNNRIDLQVLSKLVNIRKIEEFPNQNSIFSNSNEQKMSTLIVTARKINYDIFRFHQRYLLLFDRYQPISMGLVGNAVDHSDYLVLKRDHLNKIDGRKMMKYIFNDFNVSSNVWPFGYQSYEMIDFSRNPDISKLENCRQTLLVHLLPMLTLDKSKFKNDPKINKTFKEIPKFVTVPQFIQKLAHEFIQSNQDDNLIAIHWRFSKHEFSQKQFQKKYTNSFLRRLHNKTVEVIFDTSLTYLISEAVIHHLKTKVGIPNQNFNIYISGPQDSFDQLSRLAKNFVEDGPDTDQFNRTTLTVQTSKTLYQFLNHHLEFENTIFPDHYETSSMLEQYLCITSKIFIHNRAFSTWSGIVSKKRKILEDAGADKTTKNRDPFLLKLISDYLFLINFS